MTMKSNSKIRDVCPGPVAKACIALGQLTLYAA